MSVKTKGSAKPRIMKRRYYHEKDCLCKRQGSSGHQGVCQECQCLRNRGIQALAGIQDHQMVVKTIRKNPNKKTRRNMTYANMEEFIKTLNNSEAFLAQFGLIRQRSQIQKSPYQYVLNWFEATFADEIALKDFMEQKDEARTQTDVAKSA